MRNQNRVIDKTYLSLDLAEERGLIHRDYIAHCFRWSHVVKFLNQQHRYKEARILDVGCGKEIPLAKTLYVNKMTPARYVGVDVNDFEIPAMLTGKKIPITIWAETDFCALDPHDVGKVVGLWPSLQPQITKNYGINGEYHYDHNGDLVEVPNILVCFECLEHVQPEHCRRMLQHFKELTSDSCHYFISTPCWNGSAAENHINEMTFAALGALIEDLGYNIEGVYGTFASISDYEQQLADVTTYDKNTRKVIATTDLRPIFAALRNYYDTNALSTIFAPLFPAQSRNCLWHLTKKQGDSAAQDRLFSALESTPQPWSQSPSWKDLAG
jgi:hypothetical protein